MNEAHVLGTRAMYTGNTCSKNGKRGTLVLTQGGIGGSLCRIGMLVDTCVRTWKDWDSDTGTWSVIATCGISVHLCSSAGSLLSFGCDASFFERVPPVVGGALALLMKTVSAHSE